MSVPAPEPLTPPPAPPSFWAGVARSLAVVAGFLAFGLATAQGLAGAPGAYTPGVMAPTATPAPEASPGIWLVDGFNLLHVALLGGQDRSGWWREAGRGRVLEAVARFEDPAAEIWVVFDGARPAEPDPGSPRVRVVFAPSADEWLVDRVRRAGPEPVAVVTADRRVAGRARHRGARVVAPGEFLARCGGGQSAPSAPGPATG